jgi:hypothetical protein
MNNQAASIILNKDDYTNTTDIFTGTNEGTQRAIPEVSQGPHESNTVVPWNWRQETDTAELFVAMWG